MNKNAPPTPTAGEKSVVRAPNIRRYSLGVAAVETNPAMQYFLHGGMKHRTFCERKWRSLSAVVKRPRIVDAVNMHDGHGPRRLFDSGKNRREERRHEGRARASTITKDVGGESTAKVMAVSRPTYRKGVGAMGHTGNRAYGGDATGKIGVRCKSVAEHGTVGQACKMPRLV